MSSGEPVSSVGVTSPPPLLYLKESVAKDSDKCDCRKPKTGMFTRAEKELGIRAGGRYFIGDGRTDVEAGRSMKLKTILILSGKTSRAEIEGWANKPDYVFKDLLEFCYIAPNCTSDLFVGHCLTI